VLTATKRQPWRFSASNPRVRKRTMPGSERSSSRLAKSRSRPPFRRRILRRTSSSTPPEGGPGEQDVEL
jgi:hypothetical protein